MPSKDTLKRRDVVQSDASIAFRNARDRYISRKWLPKWGVTRETGVIQRYDRKMMFTPYGMDHRADMAESHEIKWTLDDIVFRVTAKAHKSPVSNRQKSESQKPVDPRRDTTEFVTEILLLQEELRFYNMVTNAADPNYLSGAARLDLHALNEHWDEATANPRGIIELAKETILRKTGVEATLMSISQRIFRELRDPSVTGSAGAQVEESLKYSTPTSNGKVTAQLLAQWFDIPELVVAKGVWNSANHGQTQNNAFIWGNEIMVGAVLPRPREKMASFGFTIESEELNIRTWRMPERDNAEMIEAQMINVQFATCELCLVVLENVLETP